MKTETIDEKLARLNQTQRDWMLLDSSEANTPKGKDVLRRMKEYPSGYISYNENGQATAIVGGAPLNQPMPIADVIKYHFQRLNPHVAWNASKGEWTMIPKG